MKTCTKCKVEKSKDEFHKHRSGVDGLKSACKSCRRAGDAVARSSLVKLNISDFCSDPDKECRVCKITKPTVEFYLDHNKVGNRCKECTIVSSNSRYLLNKDLINTNAKIYHISNKEAHNLASKNWYLNNKDRHRENNRIYSLLNVDSLRASSIKWVNANPEKVKKSKKAYKTLHPDVVCRLEASRRASKLNATPSWGNAEKVSKMYKESQERSRSEGISYHVDHIVPLNSKLVCGLHWEGNLQIILASENLKKSNKTWPDMP